MAQLNPRSILLSLRRLLGGPGVAERVGWFAAGLSSAAVALVGYQLLFAPALASSAALPARPGASPLAASEPSPPRGTSPPTASPWPTRTPPPTATPAPTRSPRSSSTPWPTRTPRPSATPWPTHTPRPPPTPTPTPTLGPASLANDLSAYTMAMATLVRALEAIARTPVPP